MAQALLVEKDKKGFLLIPIDDFDLNISGAYEMLEDIRQFLIQSNVIILIACKIEQLQDSIEQNFRTEYKVMMPKPELSYLSDKPGDMASKYLLKLIPLSRRLIIPELNIREKNILVENSEKQKAFVIKKGDKILYENDSLQTLVLDFIYKETKTFITTSNNHDISIIPKTLRELNNLVSLIYNSTNKKITFKDYIITTAKTSLSEDLLKIFTVLEDTSLLDFNVQFCNLIGEIDPNKFEFKTLKFKDNLLNLLNPRNNKNTSLGDVYAIIKIIDENVKVTSKEVIKFLTLIKVYLAILLQGLSIDKIIEISQGGFSNEYFKIFPQFKNDRTRDWLNFELKKIDNLDTIQKFILSFYIPYLGEESNKYRLESENIFFKPYNGAGGQFTKATFSPIFPLTRVIYLEKIADTFKSEEKKIIKLAPFFKKIEEFLTNDFSLILNPFYYLEFVNLLENKTKNYREKKLGDYGDILDLYINDLGAVILDEINLKYKLSIVNYIKENPIYKEIPNHLKVFNEIFQSFKGDEVEIKSILIDYKDKIQNNAKKKDALTRLKKALIAIKAPDSITSEITNFRTRLNTEQEGIVTKEAIEYLDKTIKLNG